MCVCMLDRVQRQEREVMLKLKQVVDKQRDELRAKAQEVTTISKEVEAVRRRTDPSCKHSSTCMQKSTSALTP